MKDGFVEVNPDSVLESLNPRPFDRERRIKHFFGRLGLWLASRLLLPREPEFVRLL